MKEFSGDASIEVDSSPRTVFDLLTNVDRLPEWNAAIEAVEDDHGQLQVGSEWTVTMHPPHMPRWFSISTVRVLDPNHFRFSYETRNADGNPSRVEWSWRVTPTATGAAISVEWTCRLETFDRRVFAGPIRKRQLAREVPGSLAALADHLAARSESTTTDQS